MRSDGGMVDTRDLKSLGSNTVRVRLSLRADLFYNRNKNDDLCGYNSGLERKKWLLNHEKK